MDEMTSVELPEIMTSAQVAQMLQVHPRNLMIYEKDPVNPLPTHRISSGPRAKKRYFRSDVQAWLRSRCSADTPGQSVADET